MTTNKPRVITDLEKPVTVRREQLKPAYQNEILKPTCTSMIVKRKASKDDPEDK